MNTQCKNSFQQGEFEGLCGVYSAINACNVITKLPWGASHFLYTIAVQELDRKGILAQSLLNGISLPVIRRLLYLFGTAIREWTGQRLRYSPIVNPNGNIKRIINNIKKWLAEDKKAVIVGVDGRGGHWTCIAGCTPKTFIFQDSDHRKILHLKYLTSGETGKDKIYRINPDEVVGLSILEK